MGVPVGWEKSTRYVPVFGKYLAKSVTAFFASTADDFRIPSRHVWHGFVDDFGDLLLSVVGIVKFTGSGDDDAVDCGFRFPSDGFGYHVSVTVEWVAPAREGCGDV